MQSQSGPGAFGAGLANGINQGLLSIKQGGADFEDRQYRQAIMDRMTANSGREMRLQNIRGRVQNPDGSINAQAFKEWQIEDPKGAGEWMQAVNPARKNPGAPVYFPNADGATEDPYVWDDRQGGYVPAGQFVSGHGLLGAVSQYMPPTIGMFSQQTTPAGNPTSVDPVNDFGKLIGDFPGV